MRLTHAILLAAIAALLLTSVPVSLQQATFGAYNPDWDGTRHLYTAERTHGVFPQLTLADQTPVHLQHGQLQALDPGSDGLLVLGPGTTYTAGEVQRLVTFLRDGGRALIAEDTGLGRDLVARLDVGIEIPGIPYYTPAYAKQPSFPIALSTGVIEGLPRETVTNRPSVVQGNGTPVLVTPEVAWLDTNTNGRPDLNEPRGPFAVAQLATVGQGKLLVVGDPSIFTRDMAEESGRTVQALLAWLVEDRDRLVVDEAHRTQGDPVGTASLLGSQGTTTWGWLGLVAAVATVLVATFRVRLRRVREHPSDHQKEPSGMSPIERAVLNELEADP